MPFYKCKNSSKTYLQDQESTQTFQQYVQLFLQEQNFIQSEFKLIFNTFDTDCEIKYEKFGESGKKKFEYGSRKTFCIANSNFDRTVNQFRISVAIIDRRKCVQPS